MDCLVKPFGFSAPSRPERGRAHEHPATCALRQAQFDLIPGYARLLSGFIEQHVLPPLAHLWLTATQRSQKMRQITIEVDPSAAQAANAGGLVFRPEPAALPASAAESAGATPPAALAGTSLAANTAVVPD